MRSWLAIALVGGLLIFAGASFQLDDTALRSSLLGGVVASAGAAAAFYFASKSADQARQDILNASLSNIAAPSLLGLSGSQVAASIAGSPLYLDASPTAVPDNWIAVSQSPQANQQTPTGSRIHVVFAGPVPDLNGMTRGAAEAKLASLNLQLVATPSEAAADSTAQPDQNPVPDSPPPTDMKVTARFQ